MLALGSIRNFVRSQALLEDLPGPINTDLGVPEFPRDPKARVKPALTAGTAPLEPRARRSDASFHQRMEPFSRNGGASCADISGWTDLLILVVHPFLALANVRRPRALDEREHGPNVGVAEDVLVGGHVRFVTRHQLGGAVLGHLE
jgi:hypothetical protein